MLCCKRSMESLSPAVSKVQPLCTLSVNDLQVRLLLGATGVLCYEPNFNPPGFQVDGVGLRMLPGHDWRVVLQAKPRNSAPLSPATIRV